MIVAAYLCFVILTLSFFFFLSPTHREYGFKFYVKASTYSSSPSHKETTTKKRVNRTTPFSLACKDRQFSSLSFVSISHTSSAKAFYFESQLEFVKAIVGIAETLRFVEPLNSNARALKLKSEIHNILEGGGDESKRLTGFVPICTVSGKLQPIVRIPEDEGYVFRTKARAPTLYVFEILGEVDSTMASSMEGGGGVIEGGGTEMNENNNSVSDVLERSLHEVEGEEKEGMMMTNCRGTALSVPSDSSTARCQSGSNNDEGYEPHSEVAVASSSSVQEDVSIHVQKNGEMEMLSDYQQQQQLGGDLTTMRTEEAAVCHHLDNHNCSIQESSLMISVSAIYPAVFLALHFLDSLDQTPVLSGYVEKVAAVEFSAPLIISNTTNSTNNRDNNLDTVVVDNDLEISSPLPQPAEDDACNLSNPNRNRTEEPCNKNWVEPLSSIHDRAQPGEGKWGERATTEDSLNMIKYVIASLHSYSHHALMRMICPAANHGMAPNRLSALEFGQLETEYSNYRFYSSSSSVMDKGTDKGLSPVVLQARDLYKEGLITAEELQTVLVKDSAFLELIEEHSFLDTQFCVNLAFGENWASKRSRIRESSPFGNLPGWDLVSLIAKSNDDLRQEVCALQLIQLFQHVFEEAELDILWLKVGSHIHSFCGSILIVLALVLALA